MTGIAGILRLDGAPAGDAHLRHVMHRMVHRGPDGGDYWIEGSTALGHLAQDLGPTSGRSPLANGDQSLVLVMDGRIDNRAEVARALRQSGARLCSESDAELVLQAYQMWGASCPERFIGDFAFAIWNTSDRALFCARDHLGAKPFYYVLNKHLFAFASEEQALLGLPGVSSAFNDLFIASALAPRFFGGDYNRSWFHDVVKLPPGHRLWIDGSARVQRDAYWRLEPRSELRFSSDAECADAFLSVFRQAVDCRLDTRRPTGVMLSGGIDSASIAAVGSERLRNCDGGPLLVLSTVSDTPETCHETRNIKSIVERVGARDVTVSVPSLRGVITLHDLKKAAWEHAHPIDNTILLPAMMYLAAQRSGCKVVCDGVDGDLVTWTPLRHMISHLRQGRWAEALREIRYTPMNNPYFQGWNARKLLATCLWGAFAPSGLLRWKRNIFNPPPQLADEYFVSREFAERCRLQEQYMEQRAAAARAEACGGQIEHIHALLMPGIPWSMDGFDPVAARYQIDARHCWVDKRLVEFFLALPINDRARDGWTKYIVRLALQPSLDPGVVWHRRKDHLGFDIVQKLVAESQAEIEHARTRAAALLGPWVDLDRLKGLFRVPDHERSPNDRLALFKMASLIFWVDRAQSKVASVETW